MSRSAVRLSGELPTRRIVLGAKPLLGPMLFATSPEVHGLGRVPNPKKGPLLFVGNHTVFGMLDIWALFLTLLEEKNILLRGLGDHVHFEIPVWGELLAAFGAVDGTRENCGALLAAGESVLVFPGGAREVAKRKGEAYRLIWKERIGFVQLAIEHGATIVPFSAVGVEDAFDLVIDADELMRSPLGPLLKKFGVRSDAIPPLAKGRGKRLLPRPEKLYFMIGEPIPTTHLRGRQSDVTACKALRDQVRGEVERGIVELQDIQANDAHRRIGARVQTRAKRLLALVKDSGRRG